MSADLVEKLDTLCETHRGSQQLRLVLPGYTNRTSLSFASKTKKVKVDNNFVPAVKGLGVECVMG